MLRTLLNNWGTWGFKSLNCKTDRMEHVPVFMQEALEGLKLSPGVRVLDATLGLGGHAEAILRATAPNGELIAVERDARNLAFAKDRLSFAKDRVRFVHDSFANLAEHALPRIHGALFDLGISSPHVDEAERGFSFQKDGPLDMRFDQRQLLTAYEVVNGWSVDDLMKLFRVYGEESWAPQIAKAILEARKKQKIETTLQLADIVAGVVRRSGKSHPATRVFQALRLVVNDEFGQIEKGLPAAVDLLETGGRLVVITFHSLEDRLVKQWIKSRTDLVQVNKKAIQPSFAEKKSNPRSRSAKLRIAEKI